ncbi:MAG: ABC transporter ATP-binding protein [Symbiobacteriia bacterium]
MLKLIRFLKPFALSVAGILLLVFFQSMAELYLPTLMANIVDTGVMKGDTHYIYQVGGFMLLVAAGSAILSVAAAYLSARTAMGFGRDLRTNVFGRVESFSLHEFDKIGTATLITRTTNDITQVQMVLLIMMRMMVMAPMMAIGGIIMAISKDGPLTWILAIAVPLLAVAIYFVATKGIPLFQAMQIKLDKLNRVLREYLTGIRVVRAFDRTEHERERFLEANEDLTGTAIRVNRIMAFMMPFMMLVMNATTISIIWFGSIRIDAGHLQVGDMMAFLQYAMQIMFSFVMVAMMFVMIPRAEASAVRINEVLETEPEIVDPKSPKRAVEMRGHVEFEDVTFSYPGAEQPALSHISFHVNPGEVTAIIGGTGSGKSTLISLIPRFYDVDSGRVLVDGVDVREMTQSHLREKIGFVPQKAVLFSGSVADNIRYGRDGATQDEVSQAAATAQATEFIDGLKEGFDSAIAQGGTNISGGQKQRLSIARALVRHPEIYIFDDSFSAVDFKTDARLRAALRRSTKDSTVLIVAQRVATVMDADRIIVLDDGQVVGIGTHGELMQSSSVYHEIVSSQLSEEELA